MSDGVAIRAAAPEDLPAIAALHDAAFGGPAEGRLVCALVRDGLDVASLVAVDGVTGALLGHALFSAVPIERTGRTVRAAALAPVAVRTDRQRTGIGTRLVAAGLEACLGTGIAAVLVLGDPAFYGRFGFELALGRHVAGPYAGPHFMALELVPGILGAGGTARYPSAFLDLE